MNVAVSFLAKDAATFMQIFCDQQGLIETTINAALQISATNFKIGDLYHGYMKEFKMFISPMGSETFTHVT